MDDEKKARQLHEAVSFVGLRAQATAIGFLQLTAELRRAGVLDEDAVGRIKEAIATNLALSRPRKRPREEYEAMVQRRLDILFAPQHDASGPKTLAEAVEQGPDISDGDED